MTRVRTIGIRGSSLFGVGESLDLGRALGVYETYRGIMPSAGGGRCAPIRAPIRVGRLRDILGEFDGLLLDGFGVLNVGGEAVPFASEMLDEARTRGISVVVVTNGASRETSVSGLRYGALGLDIGVEDVISSRDAWLNYVARGGHGLGRFGVIDSFSDVPEGDAFCALGARFADGWGECDAIVFLGSVEWDSVWQESLMEALRGGVKVMVCNPDVCAPLEGGFSFEAGFWVAKALSDLGLGLSDVDIEWFGKPYGGVFDLAYGRLQELSGGKLDRGRVAMVGDSLHTDILGGIGGGFKSVLVTGHGLFRDGGADEAIAATGVVPDYVVGCV